MFISGRAAVIAALLFFAAAALGLKAVQADELPAASDGPLGETPAQIVQRYGPVRRHFARVRHHQVIEGGSSLDGDLHEKNDVIIRVVYQQGRVVLLEFNREAGPLSSADVNLLLASTAGSFAWEQSKDTTQNYKTYRRTDNRAVAHLTTDSDGSLLIATEDANNFDDKLLP